MKLKNLVISSIILLASICAFSQPNKLQFQKCFGGDSFESTINDYGNNMVLTSDGGFVQVGSTSSNNTGDITGYHGGRDAWIVKHDSLGIIQWQRACGGSNDDDFSSVKQTVDGGYIAIGYSNSNDGDVSGVHGPPVGDVWVVKFTAAGAITWQKAFGGTRPDFGNDIIEVAGGYAFCASTQSNNGDVSGNHAVNFSDYWVVKINLVGTILSQKCYGGIATEQPYSIKQTFDGGYIVGGYANSFNNGDVSGSFNLEDAWIIKISTTNTLQWQKVIGGTSSEYCFNILQNADSSYIFTGNVSSTDGDLTSATGTGNIWVSKLSSAGSISFIKLFEGLRGSQLIPTTGGYLLAATYYQNQIPQNVLDVMVKKLNTSATVIWEKQYGGTDDDFSSSVIELPSGRIAINGITNSNNYQVAGNNGGSDLWFALLDTTCLSAEQPIIGGPPTVCANDTVTIEVTSGNIFNNTDWYWYTDTNAAPIDTGLTHQVVSNVNVTFYVRGEGVCANGPFATYTVTVTPKPNIYISGFVSNATDCGANDGPIILFVDSGGTAAFDFYLYNV